MENVEKLRHIINESSNIVFFGGAGVSTESDIPDFRSQDGLYKTKTNFPYPPEVMLSHSFFCEHTEDFFHFYKSKMIYKNAKPNKAHYALGKLENMGKVKAVITQNIDGLHQEAGSKEVIELHGSIHRNYCIDCGKFFDLNYVLHSEEIVPKCDKCGGIVKPDVVLYEEALNMNAINKAINYVENADVLIIGGTSLVVYPAANLVHYYNGNKLILINKDSTSYDSKASLVINDKIGEVLNQVIKKLS
ncbi:NAD-dependent deacetylase [Clostridium tetanomorphum]|uniref:NAD-dependent protein deacetylase n=1 Tax=Clostridium tetanomorphum TaxID=1553 RepID=A0A923J2X2_CLOTT|nr:NAD-dependent protein deacylase [Clostridium tetanomorphum]KAJ49938.1 NAD-dependent deacetylase [Clostridium tetanomorphum DSM 665]MBC2399263.1 NAD-dependent protein deacylase [Clostridium tetanomorphum]MBP1866067.1 NAD-dependent deacetylase [Clostridium tetanomorphum]NRS86695.1 NAD-dependent deacetylase [Clostridium tetanomorphum]NRZ99552.1 NAD-dependent deacetylase [Clostridium tetanomorphum]